MSERLSRDELATIRGVLEDRRKRWEMSPGEALETIEVLLEHIAALEAENERLRHDADQWRRHERGVARACEQGIVDLARLTALGEEVGK